MRFHKTDSAIGKSAEKRSCSVNILETIKQSILLFFLSETDSSIHYSLAPPIFALGTSCSRATNCLRNRRTYSHEKNINAKST